MTQVKVKHMREGDVRGRTPGAAFYRYSTKNTPLFAVEELVNAD